MDYTPDRRGTGRWLRESNELAEIVRDRAERGAEFLRGIAPVDDGEYRDSIGVETGRDLLVGDRVAAFVVVGAGHAAAQDLPRGPGGRPRRNATRPLARTLGYIEGGG